MSHRPCLRRWSGRRVRARVFPLTGLALAWSLSLGRLSAASVTLAWDANTDTDLAGYRLLFGTSSRVYSTSISVPASTTTATVSTLQSGRTYYFAVTAFNSIGAESAYSAEVTYTVPGSGGGGPGGGGGSPTSPLIITITGDGAVTPNLNGQSLVVGRSYNLTAVPATGSRLVAWSGDVRGTAAALSFVMVSNMAIAVTFEADPAWLAQGTYNGLFMETDEVRHEHSGNFIVTSTSRRTYSGKIQLNGRKYTLKGLLGPDCKATNVITRLGFNPLTVELALASGRVTGRVTDGSWTANLLGDRQVFNLRTNPAPFAGSYTVVIPADQVVFSGPRGDGYGAVRIDGKGMASFVGMLADGTKATQKVALSADGYWPFYLGLYKGGGSALGWLGVTNELEEVGGRLSWIKPALGGRYYSGGFTNEMDVAGSSYVAPTPEERSGGAEQIDLTCTGGNLPVMSGQLLVLPNGKMVSDPGNAFKFGQSLSTGVFRGTVIDPATGKLRSFSGVTLQKWNIGRGLVLGTNEVGQVSVTGL